MSSEVRPPLSKETIIENAQKGTFDSSPLLNTVHYVACPNCKCRQSVVLLEYLRTGKFEIGKAEQMEVLNTVGVMLFVERETFTPIIVSQMCKECGSLNEIISAKESECLDLFPIDFHFLFINTDKKEFNSLLVKANYILEFFRKFKSES